MIWTNLGPYLYWDQKVSLTMNNPSHDRSVYERRKILFHRAFYEHLMNLKINATQTI